MKKNLKSENGITLITLVVSIIIILILALVAFWSSTRPIEESVDIKNRHELSEVKKATMVKKTLNLKKGYGEEFENAGFEKVKVENAPENFVSVDSEETIGYLIDLDFVQYNNIKTGHGYTLFSSGDTVTFGKDDVYIYDAEDNVFYVLGYELSNGEILYTND